MSAFARCIHRSYVQNASSKQTRSLGLRLMREKCPQHYAARQRVASIRTVPNVVPDEV